MLSDFWVTKVLLITSNLWKVTATFCSLVPRKSLLFLLDEKDDSAGSANAEPGFLPFLASFFYPTDKSEMLKFKCQRVDKSLLAVLWAFTTPKSRRGNVKGLELALTFCLEN